MTGTAPLSAFPRVALLVASVLASVLAGCEAYDDDVPPADAGADANADADDPSDERRACEDAIARAATECPPLATITIIDFDDDRATPRPSVFDLTELATEVPGGAYVPVTPSLSDQGPFGYVLADGAECHVSCIVECDVSTQALCFSLQREQPSCSFCGPSASLEACEDFVAACQP